MILNVEKSTKEESIVAKYKPKHHQKVREGAEKFPPPGIHVNVSELADSGYSRQSMVNGLAFLSFGLCPSSAHWTSRSRAFEP